LVRQAEERAAGELAALEQMLGQTKSNAPRLRQALEDLAGLGETLRRS
jgi:hypothetical protein